MSRHWTGHQEVLCFASENAKDRHSPTNMERGEYTYMFREDFVWGVASSAYQVEGKDPEDGA